MPSIAILSFGGLSALPIHAAQSHGLFKAAGITVKHDITRSSAQIRDGLLGGTTAVAHLAPDNVVAWSDEGDPVRAWLAGSNGPIALVGRGVGQTNELRGRRIGVDSARSGFVTILRRLLELAGVEPDEVELVPIGATRTRYQALMDGTIEATMLSLPWSRLAVRGGAVELGDHRTVAPGLLTSCAASMSAWLDSERATAGAYAGALSEGLARVRDPRNREATAALLAESMKVDAEVAHDVLAVMEDPDVGWPASVGLRASDLAPALALRATTSGVAAGEAAAYVAEI